MDRKEKEQILIKQRENYQRYLGIALEEQDSKLQLVAESVMGIQEQLSALREMVAKNTENIEIMKADIQFIKQELGYKVGKDEFNILEKRVMLLERRFNTG
jgi:peptidoglycan hydrolase CwlO-like protein